MRRATINLFVVCLSLGNLLGCGSDGPADGPDLSPEQRAALDQRVAEEAGKADGWGMVFFESTYDNLVLAGQSPVGDIALVAGSHDADFPYWGTEPWDNGLLRIGAEGYHFTQRRQGGALSLALDTGAERSRGEIRYQGRMTRAADGAEVAVRLAFAVELHRFGARQLGKRYNFLDIDRIPGMRWQPFSLVGEGTVQIADGEPVTVRALRGELEHGVVSNLRAESFALAYDYVCLARGGEGGYAFVDFVSHPLDGEGILGEVLDWYMVASASETLTLDRGSLWQGNPFGVRRPPQHDAGVLLFENTVDLGLARLRRQMVRSSDAQGAALYGLREIFEPR